MPRVRGYTENPPQADRLYRYLPRRAMPTARRGSTCRVVVRSSCRRGSGPRNAMVQFRDGGRAVVPWRNLRRVHTWAEVIGEQLVLPEVADD